MEMVTLPKAVIRRLINAAKEAGLQAGWEAAVEAGINGEPETFYAPHEEPLRGFADWESYDEAMGDML